MRVEYDRQVDAAYIHVDPSTDAKAQKTYACDSIETGGQIQLDLNDAGRLIGIEVLKAGRMLCKLRRGLGKQCFE